MLSLETVSSLSFRNHRPHSVGNSDLTRSTGGPFEYWLTRTKAQEIEDVKIIDEYVLTLQSGHLPDAMRGLQRAATMFPNTVSNSYNYKK
jgi:hypothetical protein